MRIILSFITLLFSQVSYAVVTADKSKEKVITSLTSEPIGLSNYMQMFFGLFIVVALIFGMAWFMKRLGSVNGMAAGNLKVLGGISVGQRERVVLIQAGETQLLIGVAPGEIRTLHVLDELITTQSNTSETPSNMASSFADKLHAAIKSRGKA